MLFRSCNGLTNIVLPSGVTSIGARVFSDCNSLASIMLPDSMRYIGDDAFYRCSGLQSITIPSGVTSIGGYAFCDCSNLESIKVDENNRVYDSRENCNAIIEKSSNKLVIGCKNTKVPSGVTSIGEAAFCGCSGLTSITLPESVTEIGEFAFTECSNLESIKVNENNKVYDSRENCNAIIEKSSNTLIVGCKNTKVPSGVTKIGYGAFENSGLTSITIPESVTEIGDDAFKNSGLTSITISESVTKIGDEAFFYCSNLESIKVNENNKVYDSRENCNAIIEKSSNTLIVGCKNTKVPSGVTKIGRDAFFSCSGLTSITIPEGVTEIGDSAFSYCSALTSITIPESVKEIDYLAFSYCDNLTNITWKGNIYASVNDFMDAF